MRRLILLVGIAFSVAALADAKSAAREGARDGLRYALDFQKNGIKVDGTACAVGMAAEDKARPQFSQQEIEAYAKAFGNACMGRKVF